jgi:hypothetical protein
MVLTLLMARMRQAMAITAALRTNAIEIDLLLTEGLQVRILPGEPNLTPPEV